MRLSAFRWFWYHRNAERRTVYLKIGKYKKYQLLIIFVFNVII